MEEQLRASLKAVRQSIDNEGIGVRYSQDLADMQLAARAAGKVCGVIITVLLRTRDPRSDNNRRGRHTPVTRHHTVIVKVTYSVPPDP